MKVLWIADFGLKHNIGGAQRTDSFIIQEGQERGLTIEFFNYDSQDELLAREFDLVVSGNLEHLYRRSKVVEFLLNHPFHVRYEHDSNSYLPERLRKNLFGSTKHNFFLSEYHLNTFKELYGDIFPNADIITSPIDTKLFFNRENNRENKILYMGFMYYLKGTQNFFRYALMNPNKRFVVAAWGSPNLELTARSMPNVEWLGKVDYSRVPDLLNKYETLYYHPMKFEPFCRAVGEAILCGMKLDCSDNIGAVHDFKKHGLEGLHKLCSESPKKFWSIVEG